MVLRVYNTMSGQLEDFIPLNDQQVGLYVCGPTVYDWAHLGHARTYIAFDVIVRWLEYLGYSVFYIQNITDVGHLTTDTDEDKIVKRAIERKIEPMQLVEFHMREYFKDLDSLGVKRPDISPRATGHLLEMIESIKILIDKGYAYENDGNVFFNVSKFEDYGKLSKIKINETLEGSRFEVHKDKKNPRDFALWKKSETNTLLKWWSPWGFGFPGWHIECAIMGLKYLGARLDIHGGARDLIFPHHENEIAQSESITGKKPFVKYWLHTGFLKINGEKMAKSSENYITVREALKKYSAESIRLFVIFTHYRSEIDFTETKLKSAQTSLNRLYNSLESLELAKKSSIKRRLNREEHNFITKFKDLRDDFVNAMNDDFNTPKALASLFEMSKEINIFLDGQKQLNEEFLEKIYSQFLELGRTLGLFNRKKKEDFGKKSVEDLIQILFDLREKLRKKKDYVLSDEVRKRLNRVGIIIEDTDEGPKWKKL